MSTISLTSTTGTGFLQLDFYQIQQALQTGGVQVSGMTLANAGTSAGSVVAIDSTQIFTNKTYDTAGAGNIFKINGTTLSSVTGTGAVVLASGAVVGAYTITGSTILSSTISGDTIINPTLQQGGGTQTLPSATDTLVGRATTDTLTNKRVTPRVVNVTQSGIPVINTDNGDVFSITGLAQAVSSFTTNLTGTPFNFDKMWLSITDNGTGFGITWGTKFESSGNVTLPNTTVAATRLDIGFSYNTGSSKWRCVGFS